MNKTAAHRSIARRAFLTKAAGIATDYLATLPSQALAHSGIPVVSQLGALANMGGAIGGLISDPEKEKNPKTDVLSLVPGVGNYRLSQRSRRVMDESNRRGARGTANLVAEAVGPVTSSIIGAGTGGVLGGALGSLKRDAFGRTGVVPGAAVGAIAGGVLPVLIGSIAAGIRRKRTLDEQAAADTKGRAVAKYLVPGLAQYDSFKRLGASSHLDDKSKKTDKKEKKAAEAAAAGTSVLDRLKEVVGGATTRYSNLDPVVQKLLTAGIGAAAGAGVGSINLGHDREGRRRGYLLGGEKGKSRTIGALVGAIAGLHVPRVHKAAEANEAAYIEGFCKAAEAAGVDPVALYKQAFALGDAVGLGLKAWRGLRGAGAAAAKTVRHPQKSFSRLMELGVNGGRQATQRPLADFVNAADTKWEGAKRFFGGLTGARSRELARSGASKWDVNRMRAAEREFRKSMAAGVGVPVAGTVGLVGGVRALRGGNGGQPQADQGALAKAAAGSSDHSTANAASEVAGFLSPAVLGVLGHIALRRGRPDAAIAAGVSRGAAGLANLAGAVTGLAKDTRSNATQATYDSERHILKNLLPGVGAYNMWKRVGNKMRGE